VLCKFGDKKVTCTVPLQQHGIGPLAANTTGTLVDIGTGCKAVPKAESGTIAIVLKGGRCAFTKMAKLAHAAGFEMLLVIEGTKFKGKPGKDLVLPIPIAVIKEKEFKKLQKLLPDVYAAPTNIAITSMKQTPDGLWKTSTQVYWEAVKHFDAKMFDLAVEYFQYSVELEPRAHVAWHALSNTLFEMGRVEEAYDIVSDIMNLTEPIGSYKTECTEATRELMEPKGGKEGRLRVVTVATHERTTLASLRQSVHNSGHTLEVVGMGTTYPGLGLKLMAMSDWLPSVPDEDYILLVDGYDVLFLMPSEHLLANYKKFCTPVIFSAETRCHPDTALALLYPGGAQHDKEPEKSLPFHYLNSGSYIGRADFVKKMFADVHADLEAHYNWNGADYRQVNDQRWMMRYWMLHQHTGHVALDVNGDLFHTLHQIDPANFTVTAEGTLYSEYTKTSPALLHGNGADGKDMIKLFTNKFEAEGWLTKGGMKAAPKAA
jgi:hypothetical protein